MVDTMMKEIIAAAGDRWANGIQFYWALIIVPAPPAATKMVKSSGPPVRLALADGKTRAGFLRLLRDDEFSRMQGCFSLIPCSWHGQRHLMLEFSLDL